jgi:quinol-cytochrome oxidoreductase complex cytochrome b subunit
MNKQRKEAVELMSAPQIPKEQEEYKFFPDHVLTEINVGLFILFLCTILAIVLPVEMTEKANPLITPEHIKPEWYFFPMYRWIKMTPEAVGIFFPMVVVGIFIFWPFIDNWIARVAKSKIMPLIIGIIGMVIVTFLMIIEAIP